MRELIPVFLLFQMTAGQFYMVNGTFEVSYEYEKFTCLTDIRNWEPEFKKYTSHNPLGPFVECRLVPREYVYCAEPAPLYGIGQTGPQPANDSYHNEGKCLRMGGWGADEHEYTNVQCFVLSCIECIGPRHFKQRVPCIMYRGHYFLTTLLYSIFLGLVAADRFWLGYSAMAVGKLMTLGGFGVWWIVDIFLLVFGYLGPADDSSWEPIY